MNNLVFDNIIFSLQRAGGISIVWQNIIHKILLDETFTKLFIEYPNSNIFRKRVEIPNEYILKGNLGVVNYRRYLNPKLDEISHPFIFHSSYYRTTSNKLSINITTVHDFTYDYFYHGLAKKIHCWQRNGAIRRSDVIVCVSENTKQDLLKFVPEAKEKDIRIIYNGVSKDYAPISTKLSEFENYAMFVGTRSGYKNFEFAVEAISQTPYGLFICGNPLTELEKKLLDRKLGEGRYVVKIRPNNEDLNIYYNSVKFLLYPSSYEGFGIPVLEAQRAGCPVIALNSSSIPEIIGEDSLMMDRLTIDEFKNKLELIETPWIKDRLVLCGLENSKKYSWDKMSEEYLSLYQSIM